MGELDDASKSEIRMAAQAAALEWFVDAMRVRVASRSLVQRSITLADVKTGLAEAMDDMATRSLRGHEDRVKSGSPAANWFRPSFSPTTWRASPRD